MKRKRSLRRGPENNSPNKKRVRRNFVDPSKMKASWLKALVCIFQHERPVPYITGHAFCARANHPSIEPADATINWKIIKELTDLKLIYIDPEGNVQLTGAGKGIGRSLSDKPILGYD